MRKLLMIGLMLLVASMAYGEWRTIEKEDLMEGTTTTVLVNAASVSKGALNKPAIFIGATEYVQIYWGGYTLHRDTQSIKLRIDGNEPKSIPVHLSSDKVTTFISGDFVQKMMGAETVTAKAYNAAGSPMVGQWDVSGLSKSIDKIE